MKISTLFQSVKWKAVKEGILRPKSSGQRVIMFHGISPNWDERFRGRFLDVKEFDPLLSGLKKRFHIANLSSLFSGNVPKDKFSIALTFDDGYLNNYKYLLPILQKYNVPAAVFVTGIEKEGIEILWADFLDLACILTDKRIKLKGRDFLCRKSGLTNEYYDPNTEKSLGEIIKEEGDFSWKEEMIKAFTDAGVDPRKHAAFEDFWKLVSEKEIQEMDRSGLIEIGSHGYLHNNLGNIPHDSALNELKKSQHWLENCLQHPVPSLAYPDGSYTVKLTEATFKMGFTQQLACDYLYPEDKKQAWLKDRFGYGYYPRHENIIHYQISHS